MYSANYCLICKDSYNLPCNKCRNDPLVIISHDTAKDAYKLTNKDISDNKPRIFQRYMNNLCFVKDVEQVCINKYKDKTDTRSKNIYNKTIQTKEKRLETINKYIEIRKGFMELINKSFPSTYYKFESDVYDKLKECALNEDDTSYNIITMYNYCKDRVQKAYEIRMKNLNFEFDD